MPTRYYLAPIVGSGTGGDPYRSQVSDYGLDHVCVIASDPITGAPLKSACLTLVVADDFSALDADPGIAAIAEVSAPDALTTAPGPVEAVPAGASASADIVAVAEQHFGVSIDPDGDVVAQLGLLSDPAYTDGVLAIG